MVVDGELVAYRDGMLDFAALQAGTGTRVQRGIVVYLLVFDLLAVDGQDLRALPYRDRRSRLENRLARTERNRIQLVPATTDPEYARRWFSAESARIGIERVVAKPQSSPYRPGRASGWRRASR